MEENFDEDYYASEYSLVSVYYRLATNYFNNKRYAIAKEYYEKAYEKLNLFQTYSSNSLKHTVQLGIANSLYMDDKIDNANKIYHKILSDINSEEEKKAYKDKIDMDIVPAKFAVDAVVFVVSKNSVKQSLSMMEIADLLSSDNKSVIFDGTNSSNLNFVAQKLDKKPSELKFSIINGNKNIIDEINKHPEKIGVISLNTISRPYDKESQELRNSVKILPVISNQKAVMPEIATIRDMSYPFSRVLYFLTNEAYYGLGNGLIRFSCQQLGQIVVQKEGLQPYNIFKREVQMR